MLEKKQNNKNLNSEGDSACYASCTFFYVIKNKIVHYITYIVCTAYNIHTYIHITGYIYKNMHFMGNLGIF